MKNYVSCLIPKQEINILEEQSLTLPFYFPLKSVSLLKPSIILKSNYYKAFKLFSNAAGHFVGLKTKTTFSFISVYVPNIYKWDRSHLYTAGNRPLLIILHS